MKIEKLVWDSLFFNLTIGKVIIEKGEEWESDKFDQFLNKYDLIYLFDKSEKVNRCNSNRIVKNIIFFWDAKKSIQELFKSPSPQLEIEQYYNQFIPPELIKLAYTSGEFSRFKIDDSFSISQFETLYTEWVKNSLNRNIADFFLVAKDQGKIVGFVTYKKNGSRGRIGLLAVDEIWRNKGVGTALFYEIKKITHSEQLVGFEVITQESNKLAYSFYLKNDCEIIEKTNIYHIWKNRK